MTGPIVLLLAVWAAFTLTVIFLKVDAWLTERDYQRRIRGDESERYARARRAIHDQQTTNPGRVRLGHHDDHGDTR